MANSYLPPRTIESTIPDRNTPILLVLVCAVLLAVLLLAGCCATTSTGGGATTVPTTGRAGGTATGGLPGGQAAAGGAGTGTVTVAATSADTSAGTTVVTMGAITTAPPIESAGATTSATTRVTTPDTTVVASTAKSTVAGTPATFGSIGIIATMSRLTPSPTPTGPPHTCMVDITGSPTSGHAPLTVGFRSVADCGINSVHDRAWDFGDGTPTETFGRDSGLAVEHTYARPGVYTVRFTVHFTHYDSWGSDPSLLSYTGIKEDYIRVT